MSLCPNKNSEKTLAIGQWRSTCLTCIKPWVQRPAKHIHTHTHINICVHRIDKTAVLFFSFGLEKEKPPCQWYSFTTRPAVTRFNKDLGLRFSNRRQTSSFRHQHWTAQKLCLCSASCRLQSNATHPSLLSAKQIKTVSSVGRFTACACTPS